MPPRFRLAASQAGATAGASSLHADDERVVEGRLRTRGARLGWPGHAGICSLGCTLFDDVSIQFFGSSVLRKRVLDILSQLRKEVFQGIHFRALELGREVGNGNVDDGEEIMKWMQDEGLAVDGLAGRFAAGVDGIPVESTLAQVQHILTKDYHSRVPADEIQQALLPLWMPLIDFVGGCEAGDRDDRALWIVYERDCDAEEQHAEARAVRPTMRRWKLGDAAVALPQFLSVDAALVELGQGLVSRLGFALPDGCSAHSVLPRSVVVQNREVMEHIRRVEVPYFTMDNYPGVASICVHEDDADPLKGMPFMWSGRKIWRPWGQGSED